jgi:site-specific DNA recombinase
MKEVMYPRRSGRRTQTRVTPISEKPTVRVAIYTRISTNEENQPYSLEAQRKHLEQFVESQPKWLQTHFFTDQITGTTSKRPGLHAALLAAKNGEFDVLLIYRIDRISRRSEVLYEILKTLKSCSVILQSATESFDNFTPQGKLTMGILSNFAQFERDTMVDRITKGIKEKASRGEWVGGNPPFGYEVDSDQATLIKVASEAPVVEGIFRDYIAKRSGAKAIAMDLNSKGYRTRLGKLWTFKSILDILRRPTYAGYIVHHDETHEGQFEAIVSKELFNKVQELLDERGDISMRRTSDSSYLLSGLVRCTACSGKFAGGSAHSGSNKYRYYQCITRSKSGPTACASERVRADALEAAVIESLVETYGQYDLFENAAREEAQQVEREREQAKVRLPEIQASIKKVNAAISRYEMAFEGGSLKVEKFASRVAGLHDELDQLEAHKQTLEQVLVRKLPPPPSPEQIKKIQIKVKRMLNSKPTPQVKAFINQVVDHIDMDSNRTATPVLRIPQTEEQSLALVKRTIVRTNEHWVELRGIEPLTSCMPCKRSAN